jgi:hypothetical protein
MSKYFLLIPFSKKDQLKPTYKLKWDPEAKLWYTDNFEMFNHPGLTPYHIIDLDIPFCNRDGAKAHGAKWNGTRWVVSKEQYERNPLIFEELSKLPDDTDSD